MEGERLVLTNVQRSDMGGYNCIASNGIPPSVSKRFNVYVNCKYFWNRSQCAQETMRWAWCWTNKIFQYRGRLRSNWYNNWTFLCRSVGVYVLISIGTFTTHRILLEIYCKEILFMCSSFRFLCTTTTLHTQESAVYRVSSSLHGL